MHSFRIFLTRFHSMFQTYKIGQYPNYVYFSKEPNCKVEVGKGSYSGPITLLACKDQKLAIGKYCSLASDITVLMAVAHNIQSISTYSFGEIIKGNEPNQKLGDIYIGNDVWVGTDVTLLGGCIIGDGVVIGAKSLVTSKQKLEDYGVYGGVPARLLRYRFPEDTRTELKSLRWWDLDDEVIQANKDLFFSNDVRLAIEKIKHLKLGQVS